MLLTIVVLLAFCAIFSKRRGKTRSAGLPGSGNGKSVYTTPAGTKYHLFSDMLSRPHVLIAGCTGSGKSVVLNGLIHNLLFRFPTEEAGGAGLILIDPKRVELFRYRNLPHTLKYASEPEDVIVALRDALWIVEHRYKLMQAKGLCKYPGSDIYVVIDELADLMTTQKRAVLPLLQRLGQIGRAANIHMIACTQCPLASVIPTPLSVNFDAKLALRTRNAQDSRNILGKVEGFAGCHTLPEHGVGYYVSPGINGLVKLPYVTADELSRVVSYWEYQATPEGQQRNRQKLAASLA